MAGPQPSPILLLSMDHPTGKTGQGGPAAEIPLAALKAAPVCSLPPALPAAGQPAFSLKKSCKSGGGSPG